METVGPYIAGALLICFVMGCVSAAIAEMCKAKMAHGFWLGFFLGPIGWIITALLPRS